MRLKAPSDAVDGVFVGGQFFPLDADGCIEVPESGDYSLLGAMGFKPCVEPAAPSAPSAPAKPTQDDHEAE